MLHRRAANFPWRSQSLWIYSQLVRWGFIEHSPKAQTSASGVFRSDLYRRALAGGRTPLPGASLKVEGALDGDPHRTPAHGASRPAVAITPRLLRKKSLNNPPVVQRQSKRKAPRRVLFQVSLPTAPSRYAANQM